uniref:3-hydroxyisobutyryl-CoA hydrolase n=1 Tax=Peronospora matthiolae TaxID=2874970 RepID=A0AAV1T4X6_9STRA
MQRVVATRWRLVPRSSLRPVSGAASVSTKATSSFADVLYGQDTGVRTVQFNRPEKLNALTLPMTQHLTHRLQKIEANTTVNAVVFSGNGGKAFCAGGDIRALADNGKDPATRHVALDFFRHEYRLNYLLATTEKPIISFLNGVTMGGGVGLSMHGKFVVATEKTLFAMPETAIGFFPDVGASYLLPRLGRRLSEGQDYVADVPKSQALKGQGLGTYLALTGERLKGHEVIGLGLATHYLPTSEYETLVHHLTGLEFAEHVTQEERDEIIHEALEELETDEAFQEIDPEYLETIESIFGALNENDTMEGIYERLEKLNTEWSNETLTTLKKMSPLSLKVTLEQMRQGAAKTYAECFQMEYRMATRMMENPDFFEGVRSVVVDKDHDPKWAKRDITKVTPKEVEAFFEPLDTDQELILYPSATAAMEKED